MKMLMKMLKVKAMETEIKTTTNTTSSPWIVRTAAIANQTNVIEVTNEMEAKHAAETVVTETAVATSGVTLPGGNGGGATSSAGAGRSSAAISGTPNRRLSTSRRN